MRAGVLGRFPGSGVSLPDCFTLSLAKRLSVPYLFAGRERELLAETERKAFDVEIAYLEDYVTD